MHTYNMAVCAHVQQMTPPATKGAVELVTLPVLIAATISTSMPNLVFVSKSAQTLHIWELSHWTIIAAQT